MTTFVHLLLPLAVTTQVVTDESIDNYNDNNHCFLKFFRMG